MRTEPTRPSVPPPRPLRLPAALILVASIIAATGCGSQTRELEPQAIRGKVFFADGKPAHKARVTFHPVTHQGKVEPLSAKADEKGTFTLIPGLPEGEYQLSIVLTKKGDKGAAPTNTLPAKYQEPATSGLVVRIGPGNNDLDPITLSK